MLKQTIKYNEPINVSTKDGNVFIISKEDYNNLMETLYFSSIPELKKDIIKGLKKTIENCIEEDDVKW